jgi:protein-S-isoprenylcysteine O-methyltransferase Ste14
VQREQLWLAFGWCAYFLVHSLLASTRTKAAIAARWPGLQLHYRWVYNAVSTVLLVPLVAYSRIAPGTLLWEWTGAGAWIANGLALAALTGFFWTTRYYDMRAFLGLAPTDGTPRLALSPLHRFVRHPWYFLALILVWTRDFTAAWLVSAIAITVYLIVGSRLEERKLLQELGPRYAEYLRHVPGLVPRPWRYLGKAQSRALEDPNR